MSLLARVMQFTEFCEISVFRYIKHFRYRLYFWKMNINLSWIDTINDFSELIFVKYFKYEKYLKRISVIKESLIFSCIRGKSVLL